MRRPAVGDPNASPRSVVLAAIWRARGLILAAILVAGVGGYVLSARQPATYFTQSEVILSASEGFDPLGRQSFGDPTRFIANQVSLIGAQPVLEQAAGRVADTTVGDLASGLKVSGSGENDVITVGATGPTGQLAAERANAVVAAYRDYVAGQVAEDAAAAAEATTDQAVADQIRTQAAVYGDGVDLVEPAFAPGEPTSPNPLRDGLLLAAVAGLLAVGLALLRRGRGTEPVDTGAPVLGTVPLRRGGSPADARDHALAMVSLDYARQERPGPVLVTSTARNGGASSVAQGLAAAAAAQGRRVLLVDAQPDGRELLERSGGLAPKAPLESLGGTTESESEVLVPLPADDGAAVSLAVLGTAEDSPIDAEAVRRALHRLSGSFDLVVLQVAPVAESPLAFALVGQADTVVAAVDRREEAARLRDLRDRLASAHHPLAGIIVTRPVRSGRGGTAAPATGRAAAREPGVVAAPELSARRP